MNEMKNLDQYMQRHEYCEFARMIADGITDRINNGNRIVHPLELGWLLQIARNAVHGYSSWFTDDGFLETHKDMMQSFRHYVFTIVEKQRCEKIVLARHNIKTNDKYGSLFIDEKKFLHDEYIIKRLGELQVQYAMMFITYFYKWLCDFENENSRKINCIINQNLM